SGMWLSRSSSRWRASSSSSTISTRMGFLWDMSDSGVHGDTGRAEVGTGVIGNADLGDDSAAFNRKQIEALRAAVELRKARTGIAQADSLFGAALVSVERWPVVPDAEHEPLTAPAGVDFDAPGVVHLAHTVLDGVLDERLKNEVGDESRARLGLDVHLDHEPPLEANLHDLEVTLNERQLILERNLLLFGPLERGAQQLAEPGDHAPDAAGVALHQRRNRVQRIEKEMGVQLRTQRREPRV